jgi:hypothetical protein
LIDEAFTSPCAEIVRMTAPGSDTSRLRILAMAGEMAGGSERAAIWFKHQRIPGWAGKTAQDLVREGKADKVLAYLEAVRSSVPA